MHWRGKLDSILAEGVASARERERSTFDDLAGPCARSIVLYGAGNLGRKVLHGLHSHGIEPLAFADNNPALVGKRVNGVSVMTPADAVRRFGDSSVFVVCVWHPDREHSIQQIVGYLSALGAKRAASFVPLFWKYADTFLPYYLWDLPSKLQAEPDTIVKACATLTDEASQDHFVSQLLLRSYADFSCLPGPAAEPAYFLQDLFNLRSDECFIDCGAYDGDTIRDFVQASGGQFRRIIAFEPDPCNFNVLSASIEKTESLKNRAVVFQAALGQMAGKVRIAATGQANAAISTDGDVEVDCKRLDDALADEIPTFIKMDIEGSEPAALAGGQQTIKRCQPLLAVCVYHQQDHLWKLPLQMHELEPESQLTLRMYRRDGFDLVCLAVPPNRLRKC